MIVWSASTPTRERQQSLNQQLSALAYGDAEESHTLDRGYLVLAWRGRHFLLWHVRPSSASAIDDSTQLHTVPSDSMHGALLALQSTVDTDIFLVACLDVSAQSTGNDAPDADEMTALSEQQVQDAFGADSTLVARLFAAHDLTGEGEHHPLSLTSVGSAVEGHKDIPLRAHWSLRDIAHLSEHLRPVPLALARQLLSTYGTVHTAVDADADDAVRVAMDIPLIVMASSDRGVPNSVQFVGQRSLVTMAFRQAGICNEGRDLAALLERNCPWRLTAVAENAQHAVVSARYDLLPVIPQVPALPDHPDDSIMMEDVSSDSRSLPTGKRLHTEDSDGDSISVQPQSRFVVDLRWNLGEAADIRQFAKANAERWHQTHLQTPEHQQQPLAQYPASEPIARVSISAHLNDGGASMHRGSPQINEELQCLLHWQAVYEGSAASEDIARPIVSDASRKKRRPMPISDTVEAFIRLLVEMGPDQRQNYANFQQLLSQHNGSEPTPSEAGSALDTLLLSSATRADQYSQRTDLDFTEYLWLFCTRALSLEDLKSSLNAVINVLETAILKPVVHKSNPTALATVVRECLRLACLPESSTEYASTKEAIISQFDYLVESPLDWLSEVGAWKLGRDYAHVLSGGDLLTLSEMGAFASPQFASDERIRGLRCAHRLYELVMLMQTHGPNLPASATSHIVRQAAQDLRRCMQGVENDELLVGPLQYSTALARFSSDSQTFVSHILRCPHPTHLDVRLLKTAQVHKAAARAESVWVLQLTKLPPEALAAAAAASQENVTVMDSEQDHLSHTRYLVWAGEATAHLLS